MTSTTSTTTRADMVAAVLAIIVTIVGAAVAVAIGAAAPVDGDAPAAASWPVAAPVWADTGRTPRIVGVDRLPHGTYWVETRTGTAYPAGTCRREDSPGPCVWDARRRGNGVGRSFVRLTPDGAPVRIRPRVMRAAY